MEPAGLPPSVVERDRGPGKAMQQAQRSLQEGFTHMLHKLRAARPGREGFHPDRAPGRHPDHRHPRRDRPAGLPRPARQGAGRRGQVRRSQHGLAMETCYTDNRHLRRLPRHRQRWPGHQRRRLHADEPTATSSTATSKSNNTFIITKNTTTGVLARTCTSRRRLGQGRLPHQPHLVGDPVAHASSRRASGPPRCV